VVLIGHSLGGQRAVSVAELLEKDGKGADQVVTLGTPLWHNDCTKTPVVDVVAKDDPVILSVAQLPGVGMTQGDDSRAIWLDQGGHQGYYGVNFNQVADRALHDPTGGSDSTSMIDLDIDSLSAGREAAIDGLADFWYRNFLAD
jgi:hypothetical protein